MLDPNRTSHFVKGKHDIALIFGIYKVLFIFHPNPEAFLHLLKKNKIFRVYVVGFLARCLRLAEGERRQILSRFC